MFKLLKEFIRWRAGKILKDTFYPRLGDVIYRQIPHDGSNLCYDSDFKVIGHIVEIQNDEEKTRIIIEVPKGENIYRSI